ncbi:hypothetical protein, partial [Salmonella enterica]
ATREVLILRCNLIQLASEYIKINPLKNTRIYTDLIHRSADVIKNIEQGNIQNKHNYLSQDVKHTLVLYDLYKSDFEQCPGAKSLIPVREKIVSLKELLSGANELDSIVRRPRRKKRSSRI